MTAFYIVPFPPGNGKSPDSDLKIDSTWYKKHLLADWIGVKFYDDAQEASLAWDLPVTVKDPFIYGILHPDLQVVSLGTPYEDFFLWHRRIVPANYKLYLFNDSSLSSLELTLDTNFDEVRKFCGKLPE